MNIQLNTDKNIDGNEKLEMHINATINKELNRFNEHISRIEVFLADENSSKNGPEDKRCTLEARLKNMQPIAVSANANSIELALQSSLQKLKASLDTLKGKLNNH